MPESPLQLTDEQQRIAQFAGKALVVAGGAGSGKTTALAARFGALVAERGTEPEAIVAISASAAAADHLRSLVEQRLERGFSELPISNVSDFAARLLRDEMPESGLDPFVATLSGADRLAMLIERVDELELREHDFAGRPVKLLASLIVQIDAQKAALISAEECAQRAQKAEGSGAALGREFAALYASHEAMLAGEGALDEGDLIFGALSLLKRPDVQERFSARYSELLIDDAQSLSVAGLTLMLAAAAQLDRVTAVADPDSAPANEITGGEANLAAISAQSGGERIELTRSLRCRQQIVLAGQAVLEQRLSPPLTGEPGGSVHGWRCASERAQAQAIASEIEQLIQAGSKAESIAVLVGSLRSDGRAIAAALDERGVPHQLGASDQLFSRGEVKDVLAWLRLLTNPSDASATVRALARAPIELRAVDLARCVQIARRRKLDMVSALNAATESPQIPPEARERIVAFLKLQRQAAGALDELRPDRFVHRLIERLGLRRQQLFAAQADVVEGLRCLARFEALAGRFAERSPQASGREFAEYVVAVADAGLRESDESAGAEQLPSAKVAVVEVGSTRGLSFDHVFVAAMERRRSIDDELRKLSYVAITRAAESVTLSYSEHGQHGEKQPASQLAEAALAAAGGQWEERSEELFGPDEALHGAFNELRDELLGDLPRVAGTFAELRLDNDLDLTLGVVRYLELAKLAAVIGRPADQDVESALAQANTVLLQSATATQREALESSPLDELILGAEDDARARSAATARRGEPSLEAFLPRRGEGLVLSASDIETYRACPLRYKFARVFRIPQEPTMNQRFGILFHQVLERYHQSDGRTVDELLALLEEGWRRGGFGDSDQERQLHSKAEHALRLYQQRTAKEESRPVWFEKSFQFKLGEHTLRGRVDRVDLLPGGGYELIDYKTGKPRTAAELQEDIQLSLYAVAAREAWQVESELQSYHYVLDDEKIPVPAADIDRDWIAETVNEVAAAISGQGFEPTPSVTACGYCDFRIACPAAEL